MVFYSLFCLFSGSILEAWGHSHRAYASGCIISSLTSWPSQRSSRFKGWRSITFSLPWSPVPPTFYTSADQGWDCPMKLIASVKGNLELVLLPWSVCLHFRRGAHFSTQMRLLFHSPSFLPPWIQVCWVGARTPQQLPNPDIPSIHPISWLTVGTPLHLVKNWVSD